ncbi:hypothetical protein I6F65_06900 [Pseudoalteromonas sp. SWXJZ94C]|uniref:hypothetical protein n=1 Tax=Pseudoalteromonas sp. SWXJZ94C TaxID=2792065 RepID=UPI0018CF9A1A|nr:hypothetical protein [Pseudoalteromonas sp. SWXJZ94C]MBH0056684.1 hypothetical protein [Pseudoalteromonas sp. SWXJZ94C]
MHPDIQNNLKIRPAHIASFIVFLLVSMSTLTAKVYATDAGQDHELYLDLKV